MEPYPARLLPAGSQTSATSWSPSRHSTRNTIQARIRTRRMQGHRFAPHHLHHRRRASSVILITSSLDLEQVPHSETLIRLRRSSPHFDDARYYSFLSSSPYSSAYAAQPSVAGGIYPESPFLPQTRPSRTYGVVLIDEDDQHAQGLIPIVMVI
jgi:hypothetical protein